MEVKNLKLWESFLSGLAGAVIAAIVTYWSTVQKTANDAEIKKILADTKEQYLMQIEDSIKKISRAEVNAEYTVKNAEEAVLNSQKIISEMSSTGEKAKQILVQLEQIAKDSNKTAVVLDDKDKREIREKLVKEIRNIETPIGAVLAFNLNQCPEGWSEYTPAYGRFIRGIDKVGNIDPAGIRVAGSTQEDSIKEHRHETPAKQWAKYLGGSNDMLVVGASENGPPRYTTFFGDKETRPKNIALLYCQKI